MHRRKIPNGTGKPGVQPKRTLAANSKTLSWSEIPEWQKGNEYILGGYRPVQNRWLGCVASIFGYFHNETVNVHTHFGGAILFIVLLATFQTGHVETYATTTLVDTCVIAIFLVSAVFYLSASAIYHTSTCHSREVSVRCHAFDYLGIIGWVYAIISVVIANGGSPCAVLTVGSFVPCIFYGFFCDPVSQALHLLAIAIAGACATYVVLDPEYARPTHRGARTGVFIALGLCAVVPVTQLLIQHGPMKVFSEMGFGWLLTSGTLYIGGALIYANRVPERMAPGKFDYLFASHQIFHVCVVLAALSHWYFLLTVLKYSHSESTGRCP